MDAVAITVSAVVGAPFLEGMGTAVAGGAGLKVVKSAIGRLAEGLAGDYGFRVSGDQPAGPAAALFLIPEAGGPIVAGEVQADGMAAIRGTLDVVAVLGAEGLACCQGGGA